MFLTYLHNQGYVQVTIVIIVINSITLDPTLLSGKKNGSKISFLSK